MNPATVATNLNGGLSTATLRRVTRAQATGLAGIADKLGCAPSAIVQLSPFLVDDSFVTVLAPATVKLRNADLIVCLRAAVVRRMAAHELLLGFQLSQPRHTVYLLEDLLHHDEVFLCIQPPHEYAAASPLRLQTELRADVISLPSAPEDSGALMM